MDGSMSSPDLFPSLFRILSFLLLPADGAAGLPKRWKRPGTRIGPATQGAAFKTKRTIFCNESVMRIPC